jgi:pimeloyl-ACP methyl ester carboxylesterase
VLTVADNQCFVGSTSDTSLVVFRGTANVRNWLSDLDTIPTTRPYGRIHRGFYNAFLPLRDWVLQQLAAAGKPRVVIVGHSLGGALANLLAVEAPSSLPVQWVFTFGQPRVGIGSSYTGAVNNRYGKQYVRFVNNNDVVPRVPPWPFAHVGRLVQFDANGAVGGDPEALFVAEHADEPPALSVDEFERLKAKLKVSPGAEGVATAEGLFPNVADHPIAKYVALVDKQITG